MQAAAAQIAAETGLMISVAPGRVPDRISRPGEVIVRVADYSDCGPLSVPGTAGCGGPSTWFGKIYGGDASLAPQVPCESIGMSIVAHELGHAFGLGHTYDRIDGLLQLMYPTTESGAPGFRAGDRAGLRAVAGRPSLLSAGGAAGTVADPTGAAEPGNRPLPDVDTGAHTSDAMASATGAWFSQPVTARALDTRNGIGSSGAFAAEETRTISLAGVLGTEQAAAVVLNLTATGANADGYVTAYPGGSALPRTSNVNYVAGSDSANMAIVGLGPGNTIALTNVGAPVHVLADVLGIFSTSGTSGFVAAAPSRVLDTRESAVPNERGFPLGCEEVLQVTDERLQAAGIPLPQATAEVLTLTSVDASADGFVSLLPESTRLAPGELPGTSALNVAAGTTRANLAISPGANGWMVYNSAQLVADAIADVCGWFVPHDSTPGTAAYVPVAPARVLDTRNAIGSSGTFATGEVRTVALAGSGVPASASAVVVNVTATDAIAPGYLTLFPGGASVPDASNVNYPSGRAVPNLAIVKLAGDGSIRAFASSGAPNVLVDVVGYFAAP